MDEWMEYWSDGILEYWSNGVLECWSVGLLHYAMSLFTNNSKIQ